MPLLDFFNGPRKSDVTISIGLHVKMGFSGALCLILGSVARWHGTQASTYALTSLCSLGQKYLLRILTIILSNMRWPLVCDSCSCRIMIVLLFLGTTYWQIGSPLRLCDFLHRIPLLISIMFCCCLYTFLSKLLGDSPGASSSRMTRVIHTISG